MQNLVFNELYEILKKHKDINSYTQEQISTCQQMQKLKKLIITIKGANDKQELIEIHKLTKNAKLYLSSLEVLILKRQNQKKQKKYEVNQDALSTQTVKIINQQLFQKQQQSQVKLNYHFLKKNDLLNYVFLCLLKTLKQVKIEQLSNLHYVDLSYCKDLKIIEIQKYNKLLKLNLTETGIQQEQIQKLMTQLPNLQQLNLCKCQNISQINIKQHKRLQKLDISRSGVCLLNINQCQNFHDLRMEYCYKLQTLILKKCKRIKFVSLEQNGLVTVHLLSLPKLRYARFKTYKLSLAYLYLDDCQQIKKLALRETSVKVLQLRNLPSLKHFCLDKDISLQKLQIKNCTNVKSLILSSTSIDDSMLKNFVENLPNCKYLNLSNSLKFSQLKWLSSFSKYLTKINLRCTKIKQKQLIHLNQENVPLLQELNLQNRKQYDVQLRNLPMLKKLQLQENLVQNLHFQNIGIELLNINSTFNSFKKLDISNCSNLKIVVIYKKILGDIEELIFKKLSVLEQLFISTFHYQYVKQLNLSQCQSLKKIKFKNIYLTRINTQQLKNLQQIKLQYCKRTQQLLLNKNGKLAILDLKYIDICQITFPDLYLNNSDLSSLQRVEQYNFQNESQSLTQNQNNKNILISIKQDVKNTIRLQKLLPYKLPAKVLFFNQNLKHLKQLLLSNNLISNIQFLRFIPHEQLKIIDLQSNIITNIKAIQNMKRLPHVLKLSKSLIKKRTPLIQNWYYEYYEVVSLIINVNTNSSSPQFLKFYSMNRSMLGQMQVAIVPKGRVFPMNKDLEYKIIQI